MQTRKYRCVEAIPFSFFSADLYRDVARNWRWTTFFYLCFVAMLCAIPITLKAQHWLGIYATEMVDHYVGQIPPIRIENGIVITPDKKPYIIRNPGTNEVVAMIDTTGAHKSLENEKFDILMTENSIMMMNREDNTIKIKKFSNTLNTTFDPKVVKEKAPGAIKWAWIFLFPLFTFLSIVYRFLQAMLYGLFGKILALFFEIDLMYEVVVRLAMVALTPTMIVSAVLTYFDIYFRMQNLLLFAIGIGYVFFAVMANEKD